MSQYKDIMDNQPKKRGRKPLPPAEKARRLEEQKIRNRQRQEARRRANIVLQHKYADEYSALYEREYESLIGKKG